ncbi:hypothetical protein [Limnoglobus roseus]|uniref:Uncharacterized protein n=1 Tax=Limnoglobus roseus TaxID=2598579 RepID=A0A5C1ABF4_9BACT|nr:hypothetical protein [Limnoglobus roseus]QEL15132.1 hypothetical protein PX52LOC_02041 [Limnoglobus roseus]
MDKKSLSERDICTKFITPAVKRAGWDEMAQIREEVSFTKGRITGDDTQGKEQLDNFIDPESAYPDNKAMCRIYTRTDADFVDRQLWPQQSQWLREHLETMHRVFAPRVKNLKLESEERAG